MNHTLQLQIAQSSLPNLSQSFLEGINKIQITVDVSYSGTLLCLKFIINIPEKNKLNIIWPDFNEENIKFQNFLWEESCLECFLGNTATKEYIEINASPQGMYAIYHFDSYRLPASMPPKSLLSNINADHIPEINWILESGRYQRSFTFDTAQLPFPLEPLNLFNPTAILYLQYNNKNVPLFFAYKHATTPDFHQKDNWLTL